MVCWFRGNRKSCLAVIALYQIVISFEYHDALLDTYHNAREIVAMRWELVV